MGSAKLRKKNKKTVSGKKTAGTSAANRTASAKTTAGKENRFFDITGILVIAAGILFFLSMYFEDSAGLFGSIISSIMLGLLGVTGYIVPFIVFAAGIMVLFRRIPGVFRSRIKYLLIFIFLLSAIINTGFYERERFENARIIRTIEILFQDGVELEGGGVIGGLISMPFLVVFQTAGTLVILSALTAVILVLLTNISVSGLLRSMGSFFSGRLQSIALRKKERAEAEAQAEAEAESAALAQGHNLRDNSAGSTLKYRRNQEEKSKEEGLIANTAPFRRNPDKRSAGRLSDILDLKADAALSDIGNQATPVTTSAKPAFGAPGQTAATEEKAKVESVDIVIPAVHKSKYIYPGLDLLTAGNETVKDSRTVRSSAIEGARKLEETLRSFQVEARVINVSPGPTVTRYELQPGLGVKVNRIVTLADDIALNLASGGVRIEAPIPGKAAIGIEVANTEVSTVYLRDVLASESFTRHPSRLSIALGKDITGENIVANIVTMPHLLIAGATGSGKSVCINSLIISILYKASPDEVRLLMIDPKVVELVGYNGIPHLLVPVVTDPRKAAGALNWAVKEMLRRYKLFAEKGVRDLARYNDLINEKAGEISSAKSGDSFGDMPGDISRNMPGNMTGDIHGDIAAQGLETEEDAEYKGPDNKDADMNEDDIPMPQIVIIIDELADLMMVAPNDVEDAICRLAQMARAAGIHLVIATQRPSVDVITGVIKANIPSRISFAVSSQFDSRTILDMAGAERLLGRGDMLFYPTGRAKPLRVQGSFISDKEVEKVVSFVKKQGENGYDDGIIDHINSSEQEEKSNDSDRDELLDQAIEMVVDLGQASVSFIQRKFRVGYSRAARIIDQMEERGIVGKFEGSKPRQVLVTKLQWQEMQSRQQDG
ncbi:MAG: DNA translocase FtsK 4TM domain-containing protein [Eubacteriales bacterium]|nr:DNA translocase FtsK 4TM domain-containing protein [Eubacteriales bacterium]